MLVRKYCAYDAAITWRVHRIQSSGIKTDGLTKLYQSQRQVLSTLIDIEHRGIHVDPVSVIALRKQLAARVKRLEKRFQATMEKLSYPPVLMSSAQQLSTLLYSEMRFTPQKRTPKGVPSVDKSAIPALYPQVEEIADILGTTRSTIRTVLDSIIETRGLKKMISTYLDGIAERVHDEHVHANFNLTGTVTGRLSSSRPNMQNIPRDATAPIKQIFTAVPKHFLIAADYSQIELRIGAYLTRDANMLQLLRSGADLHTETARQICGREPSKEERSRAKTVNFGVFYGMGMKALAEKEQMTEQAALRFIRAWHRAFPAVKRWQKEQEETLKQDGYVSSPFGRRRRFNLAAMANEADYAHAVRQACNFPVQSMASELTLLAMAKVNTVAPVILNVHDSIMVQVPKRGWKKVAKEIREVMEDVDGLVKTFGWSMTIDVPIRVDLQVGECWANLENYYW
ncbi:MAG: hypothetical protein HC801_10460 [Nitrospira sp.]|nr:hypothetical protein [Nitrospira sp.]